VAVQQTATFYLYSRSGIGQADCFKVTVAPGGGSFAIRISLMRPVFYSEKVSVHSVEVKVDAALIA
jgi:hypothetical protein